MTTPAPITGPRLSTPDVDKIKAFLTKTVMHELEIHPTHAYQYRSVVRERLDQAYDNLKLTLPNEVREGIIREVFDELVGFGPIQSLLEDPEISEVMVTGPKQVYIERNGELLDTGVTFQNDDQVYRLINRIVNPLGRRVDIDNPTVDARLPDGSRVNVVVPPVAIDGPCITIRKFLKTRLTMDQFVELGSITPNMVEFLKACIVARLNVLISGNTSSGKTTLLNILTGYIPGHERIITIEDAGELKLNQKYVVRLETKNPNPDGTGTVNQRDLVKNSLRMRPDRIIVGEVRGGEALDMLQAMNTGHDGSLTTLHANTPRDAISRLETMVMMAGLELPVFAIRRQIASSINLIVHMARLQDGSRRITNITEIVGMEGEIVTTQDIFRFEQTGTGKSGQILGDLRATGIRPHFSQRLEIAGSKLRNEIFMPGGSFR
jgi:pilus assembly protein CpaF